MKTSYPYMQKEWIHPKAYPLPFLCIFVLL
nr:MAG TPA: Ribosome, CHIMERIC HYBRID STATE RIBOSOME [Caudoviricetes sp.]